MATQIQYIHGLDSMVEDSMGVVSLFHEVQDSTMIPISLLVDFCPCEVSKRN